MNMKSLLIFGMIGLLAACHHQTQPQDSNLQTSQYNRTVDLDSAMATLDMAEFAARR